MRVREAWVVSFVHCQPSQWSHSCLTPAQVSPWHKCYMHYSSSQDSPTALGSASWRLIPSHVLRTACGDVGKQGCTNGVSWQPILPGSVCCTSSNIPNADLETKTLQSPITISMWFHTSLAERNTLLFLVLWWQCLRVIPCLTAPWRKGSWDRCMDVVAQAHGGAFIPGLHTPVPGVGDHSQHYAAPAPVPGWGCCPRLSFHRPPLLQGVHSQKSGAALYNKSAAGERWDCCSIFKHEGISLYFWSLGAQTVHRLYWHHQEQFSGHACLVSFHSLLSSPLSQNCIKL